MSEKRTLAWALTLARAGIWVFPCKHHAKTPATAHGFKDATIDEAQIRAWFGPNGDLNLAIRCGPQPNGWLNLVGLDIDPDKGGDVSWAAWVAEHPMPTTVRHETPSENGFHVFFNAPEGFEFRPSAGQFAPGIDVRASDSYVVAPPSWAPSKVTGELLQYRGHRELFIGDRSAMAAMPSDIHERLVAISGNGHVEGSVERHPSRGVPLRLVVDDDDSVADLARVGWVWHVELERDGWVLHHVDGDKSYWTRPGKNPRLGSSACLHEPDGPLVTFSTSLPVGGKAAAGAAIGSFSPWDYIVTFRAGGDTRLAARLVRGVSSVGGPVRATPEPPVAEATSLYLPDSFWSATPLLWSIYTESLRRLRTPDAVLAALLTMYATTIPMGIWLPGVVGRALRSTCTRWWSAVPAAARRRR